MFNGYVPEAAVSAELPPGAPRYAVSRSSAADSTVLSVPRRYVHVSRFKLLIRLHFVQTDGRTAKVNTQPADVRHVMVTVFMGSVIRALPGLTTQTIRFIHHQTK